MLISVCGLGLVNLLMLYGLDKDLFGRQVIFWLIGLTLFLIFKALRTKNFFNTGFPIYFLGIFFLLTPIVFGQSVRGSARWIDLGFFRFQPSEIVKPILIGFFAWWLSKFKLKTFWRFTAALFLVAIPVLLVFVQPDLGSAGILVTALLFLIILSKPKLVWWLPLVGLFLLGLLFGWQKILKPYQIDRVTAFLSPEKDPLGKGYNQIQARLAIGSGGILGRGFGRGRQTQLAFLPEKQTDFIFASIAEELGLVGVLFVLGFYLFLYLKLWQQVFEATDPFTFKLRLGILVVLVFQTAVNLAMNLGLFPVVGVPLPFLSYGGSSLIASILSLALSTSV